MPRKRKVFRTPTGFHDAYVAAPSRKAALEAWGAAADLFARGDAEQVTEPRLMAEPLKHPGEVIRVSRGDLKAQLKALGPRKTTKRGKADAGLAEKPVAKMAARSSPPKRDEVDRAEAALARAQSARAKDIAALERQRDAVERKLDTVKARHTKTLSRLEERLDKAKAEYRESLDRWSG